jgi:hypothetical protein
VKVERRDAKKDWPLKVATRLDSNLTPFTRDLDTKNRFCSIS